MSGVTLITEESSKALKFVDHTEGVEEEGFKWMICPIPHM